MNYSDKIKYLRVYVNTGMNFKAKDFILNEWILTEKNENYDKTVLKLPETMNYIDNLIVLYRKQFPVTDQNIQKIVKELSEIKYKKIQKQKDNYYLF